MSLFDMCCPRKPKKSLDYVIKWVEDTDKTIKDLDTWISSVKAEDLKPIFDEYAEGYDWSKVPEFNAKADKVENATEGHLAALDSSGNLVDSGSGIGESIEQDNMDLATCNAVYMALQGFAPSTHSHSEIKAPGAFANYAYARIAQSGASAPAFFLKVGGANDMSASVQVNVDNIENLRRALANPSTTVPEDDDTKLITSKAVYNYAPRAISNAGYGVSVDADGEIHIGSDYVVISVDGGEAEINSENIDNLNRALEAPDNTPASGSDNLITSNAVYDALANRAYAETLNQRKLQLGGIYLVKGTTLADYTIENISDASMQLYISGIAEIGGGRTDHLVIGLKDGATTHELLSTVHVGDSSHIALYIGDIAVEIIRNSAQDAWRLGGVTKISSLF